MKTAHKNFYLNRHQRTLKKDFKKEALKQSLDGQSVATVSREIWIAETTFHNWKKERISEIGSGMTFFEAHKPND